MEIQGTRVGSITVMTVSGRMDVDSSGEFEKELNTVIEAGARTIAVDLKGLDYISSAGLRAVLSMTKILKVLVASYYSVLRRGRSRMCSWSQVFHRCFRGLILSKRQ